MRKVIGKKITEIKIGTLAADLKIPTKSVERQVDNLQYPNGFFQEEIPLPFFSFTTENSDSKFFF